MNVLVTGGAGYIGSALLKKLLDEGHGMHSTVDILTGVLAVEMSTVKRQFAKACLYLSL